MVPRRAQCLRSPVDREQFGERTSRPKQVFQRVFVEHSKESLRRLLEGAAQYTCVFYSAEAFLLQTADDGEFLFRIANNGPDINLAWLSHQTKTAVLALHRFDISKPAKIVHHLHQVASRYFEVFGYFGNRRQFTAFQAGEH